MKGISQLHPLQPFEGVSAATMADQSGIEVQTDGTVSWIRGHKGSWTRTADVFFGERSRRIMVTGSADEAGTLYIVPDQPDGEIAAEIEYPAGEGWEASAAMKVSQVQSMYIVFGGDARLDNWRIE